MSPIDIIVISIFYNCCLQFLLLLCPIAIPVVSNCYNCCLQSFGSQSIHAGIVRKTYFNNEFCYLLYWNACCRTFYIKRVPHRFLNFDTHDYLIILCRIMPQLHVTKSMTAEEIGCTVFTKSRWHAQKTCLKNIGSSGKHFVEEVELLINAGGV